MRLLNFCTGICLNNFLKNTHLQKFNGQDYLKYVQKIQGKKFIIEKNIVVIY